MLRKAAAEYVNVLDNKELFEEMKDLKLNLRFNQIRTEGEKKGLAKGRTEAKVELQQKLVANMLSQGFDQAIIRQTLELTEKELADIVEKTQSVEVS